MKEIFYHNDTAYKILRKIKSSDCDPTLHGINRTDDDAHMKMLMVWRNWIGADHVLAVKNGFYLCETIQEPDIIEIKSKKSTKKKKYIK